MDIHDKYLVLTFVGETRLLAINQVRWSGSATTRDRMAGLDTTRDSKHRCQHLTNRQDVLLDEAVFEQPCPLLSRLTNCHLTNCQLTNRQEDELDEAEVAGFEAGALTLWCGNVAFDQMVQVRGCVGWGCCSKGCLTDM